MLSAVLLRPTAVEEDTEISVGYTLFLACVVWRGGCYNVGERSVQVGK